MPERTRTRKRRLAATLLAVAGIAASGWAAPDLRAEAPPSGAADGTRSDFLGNFSLGATKDPIRVSADELDFDYKNRVLTYRGGVEVTQGDVSVRSNTLTVHFDERAVDRDRLQQIIAEGDVRIGKGTRFATGGRAVFDQAAKTVTLSQDAVLHDGPNRVAGERVVVYLNEGRSVVEGGDQRVHALLVQPDKAAADSKTGDASGR